MLLCHCKLARMSIVQVLQRKHRVSMLYMLYWHGFASPFHYTTYSKIYIHFQFSAIHFRNKDSLQFKIYESQTYGYIYSILYYHIVPLRRIGTLLDGSTVLLQSIAKLFSFRHLYKDCFNLQVILKLRGR